MSGPTLSFVIPRDKLSEEIRGRLALGVSALRVTEDWARHECPEYFRECRAAAQQKNQK